MFLSQNLFVLLDVILTDTVVLVDLSDVYKWTGVINYQELDAFLLAQSIGRSPEIIVAVIHNYIERLIALVTELVIYK